MVGGALLALKLASSGHSTALVICDRLLFSLNVSVCARCWETFLAAPPATRDDRPGLAPLGPLLGRASPCCSPQQQHDSVDAPRLGLGATISSYHRRQRRQELQQPQPAAATELYCCLCRGRCGQCASARATWAAAETRSTSGGGGISRGCRRRSRFSAAGRPAYARARARLEGWGGSGGGKL